jgi:hypothetical protein
MVGCDHSSLGIHRARGCGEELGAGRSHSGVVVRTSASRIAVLGMGRTGRAVAGRLLEGGHHVTIWNRTPGRPDELVSAGASEADSVASLTVYSAVFPTLGAIRSRRRESSRFSSMRAAAINPRLPAIAVNDERMLMPKHASRSRFGVRHACGLAVFVTALGVAVSPAAAQTGHSQGRAVSAVRYTGLFGPLSARWWDWSLESPNIPINPNTDPTAGSSLVPAPVDCSLDQSGPVWFLAGATPAEDYGSAYRTCAIPAGRFLFFPIFDAWIDDLSCPGMPPGTATAAELRSSVKSSVDGVSGMQASIDGLPVPGLASSQATLLRASASGFSYRLRTNNWLSDFCSPDVFPAGTRPPPPGAFADGVYLLIPPLRPGVHTLHWAATPGAGAVNQDITYVITVGR